MKAVFLQEPGELVINDVPTPTCDGGMVRVRIDAVGICDDDLSAYTGAIEHQRYPIVLGRDAAGVVVEVGTPADTSEVDDPRVIPFAAQAHTGLSVDDRVVLLPQRVRSVHDHTECDERCRDDRVSQLGFNIDGTLREFAVVPVAQCAVLPEEVPMKEGVFVASICKARNAVETGGVEEDDTVAIMGAGDVGIIAAQIAIAYGAKPIVIDTSQARLELARTMGVTHTVNPFACYAAEEIEWMTSGDMADVVIDTAGEAEGMGTCLQFAGVGAQVVFTRKPPAKAPADLRYLVGRQLSVHTAPPTMCDTDAAIQLLRDDVVRVAPLISATLPMEAAPLIIPSMARNPGHYMRVVLSNS